jgi:nitrite reductase (NADH) small subunit
MSEGLRVVAKASDITEDLNPLLITLGLASIAVYRHNGKYYAYHNYCPHQGGPATEGVVVGNVECEILEGGKRREYVSDKRFNIACPWHGIEFDIETGLCTIAPRLRLKAYPVVQEGDDLKLAV